MNPSPGVSPEPSSITSNVPKGRWAAFQQTFFFLLSLVITGTLLLFLLWSPFSGGHEEDARDSAAEAVQVAGPHLISIKAGSLLKEKLTIAKAVSKEMSAPLLSVTGSIVARLSPGKGSPDARWDFTSLDLATSYADWLKSRDEETFTEKQLATIRDLTQARVKEKTELAERARKEVKIGTVSKKDLATAEADLLQTRLQAQKDLFEGETNFKNAGPARLTQERQLYQAGVDPFLLERKSTLLAMINHGSFLAGDYFGLIGKGSQFPIVVAEVPEAKVGLVKVGQAVQAKFFAIKDKTFSGRVASLAPTLNKERRTLRVFFELDDPQHQLKPGMFAEVALGTDPRMVLQVPSDALIHVGRSDYVLVEEKTNIWRVVEVTAGEAQGSQTEILGGLPSNSVIIGSGAILLKPIVAQALQKM